MSCRFHFFDLETKSHVIEHRQVFEQGVMLEDEPDVAFLHGEVVDAFAIDEDVAGGRNLQAGNQSQHGCFSAAAWAQKAEQLSFVDDERDPSHRRGRTELLCESTHFDFHWLTALPLPRRSFQLAPWRSPRP